MTRPAAADLRLIATDYDGTLLGEGRVVSDRTRAALQILAASHIEFVVITGRPPRYCDSILGQTEIELSLICANGAVGYEPITGEVTQFATIELSSAHEMVADLRAAHPDAGFCAEMGAGWVSDSRWAEITGRRPDPNPEINDHHTGEIADIIPHLDDRLHKLLVSLPGRNPDQALAEIAPVVGARVNAMHAGLPFIELMPPGVDKAFGLRRHCQERGIDASQVMTFGDMPNDIAMLEWAGWGVAVDNAHHGAKSAADEVTHSNIEHGVARIIEDVLNQTV